ncbi:Pentatricopeptide repeat-containing protein, chloroplastic [Diplodia seriata]|uniref:Pentatricopeptide repeat-containing protein, chloroplastic n=1 Tax=Diplodia seriata TaxID=420778 RepID=A0A1S8B6C7_9PEZI|nr:Pentatricopeptide repeat-containing protein, chloroplastic [Diplodia seriata]
MASRLPEQAIDVWNKMIENGIKPTIKTWTAMIDGCGKARDTEGMEQIWVRMLNSGVQPDVYAWSARVSGMMRAGRLRQGFAVLDEMAKIWTLAHKRAQSAAKKRKTKVDTAELPAKPNTVVLNGAITALASRPPRRNENFLGPVLEWAKSLSIQPDIITYNSLISLSLRSGNTEEAMNLLQRMERVNVQPDVATFSIILNSIFRSGAPTKLSQEEQHEKVMAVLGNLETHGIEVTGHIFGTLIDGLLKRHDNEVAARAVLAHMVAKGLQVPPHIYTSLMTHYFERHDLAAVDALWAQIEASGTVLDIVFFDRMIEQYARIHDVDRMMVFLKRMSNRGLAPGWPALQDVVVKLAEIGDWERFDQIVNDVEQGVGVARKGMRVSPDNVIHQFWKAVARKRALKPKPEPYQEIFPHAQQEKL